ncbi:MAG: hypothetical protein ACM3XN_11310 [Chloroflexota bacterium]
MRQLRRFEVRPEPNCMASLKNELGAELGIPRPRHGAVVRVSADERIEFSRVEVDGIIDRCEQYRPREP